MVARHGGCGDLGGGHLFSDYRGMSIEFAALGDGLAGDAQTSFAGWSAERHDRVEPAGLAGRPADVKYGAVEASAQRTGRGAHR